MQVIMHFPLASDALTEAPRMSGTAFVMRVAFTGLPLVMALFTTLMR